MLKIIFVALAFFSFDHTYACMQSPKAIQLSGASFSKSTSDARSIDIGVTTNCRVSYSIKFDENTYLVSASKDGKVCVMKQPTSGAPICGSEAVKVFSSARNGVFKSNGEKELLLYSSRNGKDQDLRKPYFIIKAEGPNAMDLMAMEKGKVVGKFMARSNSCTRAMPTAMKSGPDLELRGASFTSDVQPGCGGGFVQAPFKAEKASAAEM